jgi:hypothetical protein
MVSAWQCTSTGFGSHIFQNNQFYPTYFSVFGDAIPPQINLTCMYLGQGHLHKMKEIHFKWEIDLQEASDK